MMSAEANRHYTVNVTREGLPTENITCFKCNVVVGKWNEEQKINEFFEEDVVYPLDSYLKDPYREIIISNEYITC